MLSVKPVKQAKGRLGGLTSRRPTGDPEITEARRELHAAKIAAYIEKVLTEAPPLSDQQRTALAELLRPARKGGAA
ncbi:hypothetical protein [Mycobacterium asiaticum]|uniref:hypothetical protein n=1 Tax=Mycobacterium asiaticum TaxID=1790 RepID=UPI00055B67BB|nr:hypothetical protein [Mycobacterium asiaticum]ORA12610.1 hypothetical protein BST16_16835 [Mycobacterium asiaticum DSM 44297]